MAGGLSVDGSRLPSFGEGHKKNRLVAHYMMHGVARVIFMSALLSRLESPPNRGGHEGMVVRDLMRDIVVMRLIEPRGGG